MKIAFTFSLFLAVARSQSVCPYEISFETLSTGQRIKFIQTKANCTMSFNQAQQQCAWMSQCGGKLWEPENLDLFNEGSTDFSENHVGIGLLFYGTGKENHTWNMLINIIRHKRGNINFWASLSMFHSNCRVHLRISWKFFHTVDLDFASSDKWTSWPGSMCDLWFNIQLHLISLWFSPVGMHLIATWNSGALLQWSPHLTNRSGPGHLFAKPGYSLIRIFYKVKKFWGQNRYIKPGLFVKSGEHCISHMLCRISLCAKMSTAQELEQLHLQP